MSRWDGILWIEEPNLTDGVLWSFPVPLGYQKGALPCE